MLNTWINSSIILFITYTILHIMVIYILGLENKYIIYNKDSSYIFKLTIYEHSLAKINLF